MVKVPPMVVESWARLPGESALEALVASHSLHQAIAGWQTTLVQQAAASGASWEEIGAALGTTKQGAWARFRTAVGDRGGQEAMQDRRRDHAMVRELWRAGQGRLRELDAQWQKEHESLRRQVKESHELLAGARRRHAAERREARHKLREEIAAARH